MMTRKRMGSATAAIFVLMAGAVLPGMATAQDMPSAAASASGSDDAYRYIDDADGLLDAMGTSPPDHGFRFDGIDCWAWAMADGSTILAEPLGDDYRYYVFAPGDDYPFFVGDRTYAYGFEGRTLAAVYGDNGDLVDPSDDIVDGAAWLSERGFGMKRAMQTPEPVYAGDWADSIGWFGGIELRLDTWRNRPGWIRYRAGPGRLHHRDWREKLGAEGQKRRQRAEWFDRWRRGGYRGPPQGDGKWVTKPGRVAPDKDNGPGNRPGKGHWIGRPRPVAPPTPGAPGASVVKPGGPGRGDGIGPGRRPYPPRFGQPSVPASSPPGPQGTPATPAPLPPPVVVSPPPTRGGFGRPNRPLPRMLNDRDVPFVAPPPPPAVAPTPVPVPTPAPGTLRSDGRFERPMRMVPRPPMVKVDRDRGESLPEERAVSRRPEPQRPPAPVIVAPRPSFSPPRAPVSAPPPPPPSPPAAARVIPAPPVVRSNGPVPAPRSGGAPRGDGGRRGGWKGKDK